MAVFAKVVDSGSFTAAAKDLGLAPSRISETVSELEEYLGVTLLYRTTRSIKLTNEGRVLYDRVVEMLSSAESGLDELNALTSEPAGSLRISLPAFMAAGPISTAIANFGKRYPNVTFSVAYTDHRMSLIDDNFDMSIRVGWLDENSMMSRKLSDAHRLLVAGVEYVNERVVPQQPSDMENWDWIGFQQRGSKNEFTSLTGKLASVSGNTQIEVDSIEAVYHLATENAGVAILPSYLAERGVASGKLVKLLPDWKLEPMGIYTVWPDTSRRKSLTQTFVRFLTEQELC